MPNSITTAVIAALAGGLGAFAGTVLTQYGRRGERRIEQQRADAEVLGPVLTLLTDAYPERLAFNLRRDPAEQEEQVMTPLRDRLGSIRASLNVLHAGHPDDKVSDLAGRLELAVSNAFTSAGWLVHDLLRGTDDRSTHDRAQADHRKASELAKELTAEIARYGRRRGARRLPVQAEERPRIRPEEIVLAHIARHRPQPEDGAHPGGVGAPPASG